MLKFYRIACYTFLACMGLYVWFIYESGWQQYCGLVMLLAASVRLLTLVFPKNKQARGKKDGQGNAKKI